MRAGSAGGRVVLWNPAGWWVGEKNLNWAALIQSGGARDLRELLPVSVFWLEFKT